MYDDGLHQDQFPGDGIYGAVLPAQPDGTILKFHIEVKDSAGQQRIWPVAEATEDGGRPDALIQVLDTAGLPSGLQPDDPPLTYLIMTAAERAELADIGDGPLDEAHSNAQMNGTFIRVDGRGVEVRYGVGIRNRGGASRIGPPNNYRVDFAHDRPWNEVVAVNLNCQYVHSQIVGSAVYRLAGIPAAEAIPVEVFVNGVDVAEPGGPRMFGVFAQLEVIDSSFPDGISPRMRRQPVPRGCVGRRKWRSAVRRSRCRRLSRYLPEAHQRWPGGLVGPDSIDRRAEQHAG